MTKKLFTLACLALFTLTLTAQDKIKGNKNITIIETEVAPFSKLTFGEDFNIQLKKSDVASVLIETDDNLHEVIDFKVIDSVLSFKTTKRITKSRKMVITVNYTQALQDITLNDNAEIHAANTLNNFNLNLVVNDNAKAFLNVKNYSFKLTNNNRSKLKLYANCKLNIESQLVTLDLNEGSKTEALIDCDSLHVDMYQRADAKIEGLTKHLKANNINSTTFNGKNLRANTCQAIIEDGSNFAIEVTENLILEASGRSDISLYGAPAIQLNTFSGEAVLRKKEL
mgnify:FL=1